MSSRRSANRSGSPEKRREKSSRGRRRRSRSRSNSRDRKRKKESKKSKRREGDRDEKSKADVEAIKAKLAAKMGASGGSDAQDKLKKLKESLSKKKALLEEIARKKAAAEAAESKALPSVATSKGGPIPLILDEQGRQVDNQGRVVGTGVQRVKSLMINKRVEREKVFGSQSQLKQEASERQRSEAFDHRIAVAKPPVRRKRRGFNFVQPGRYAQKADRQRAEKKMEEFNRQLAESGRDLEEVMEENPEVAAEVQAQMEAAARREGQAAVPEVEWWDAALAGRREEGAPPLDYAVLREEALRRVTHLVEHTPELRVERPEARALPLMLTKKERKRIRREERAAAQEEQRAKITLGLIPPPPPKVKLSNMARVYGAKMVENPTAVEEEVRQAMQARLMKHLMDNELRKKTPAERREKKLEKASQDRKKEMRVALFRVEDLSHAKHLWKVEVNAKQCHCTGLLVVNPASFSVLAVEGGKKAVGHMKKLMLRRIDWTALPAGAEEDGEEAARAARNRCVLVWEGVLPRPRFRAFASERVEDAAAARDLFEKAKVPEYWDQAKAVAGVDASVVERQRRAL